jgi:hemolysin-activating ACP:hemolysin acyltransferase
MSSKTKTKNVNKAEAKANGATQNDAQPEAEIKPDVDPAVMERVGKLRSHLRETFGQVVMAMMGLPRYRHQSVMDLGHIVLEPLIRDRIAVAHSSKESTANDVAGIALWASVSEEVDARIVEQIKAGVFPIRLKSEDWNSGKINWLLDVLATDRETTGMVLGNFKQVVKEGELKVHPIISRLVDKSMLDKMTQHRAPRD